MSTASSIAASGLAAAALRLQVSAGNVANVLSFGPLPDSANAADFSSAYQPLTVSQADVAGGGTSATVVPSLPWYTPVEDPTAPFADSRGMVAAPNVDLGSELIAQMLARYVYATNARVISADARMTNYLFDILA